MVAVPNTASLARNMGIWGRGAQTHATPRPSMAPVLSWPLLFWRSSSNAEHGHLGARGSDPRDPSTLYGTRPFLAITFLAIPLGTNVIRYSDATAGVVAAAGLAALLFAVIACRTYRDPRHQRNPLLRRHGRSCSGGRLGCLAVCGDCMPDSWAWLRRRRRWGPAPNHVTDPTHPAWRSPPHRPAASSWAWLRRRRRWGPAPNHVTDPTHPAWRSPPHRPRRGAGRGRSPPSLNEFGECRRRCTTASVVAPAPTSKRRGAGRGRSPPSLNEFGECRRRCTTASVVAPAPAPV